MIDSGYWGNGLDINTNNLDIAVGYKISIRETKTYFYETKMTWPMNVW